MDILVFNYSRIYLVEQIHPNVGSENHGVDLHFVSWFSSLKGCSFYEVVGLIKEHKWSEVH